MGKINTYQRKQLASSIVGVAPQDTSGQTIGKSVVSLGAALVKRQDALDTALASTAYYDYAAANNLGVMDLKRRYQNDPTLDPLSFNTEFEKGAAILSQKYKEKLPDRVHNTFDIFVAKANASQVIANNKWAFDQQNKNAISNFQAVSLSAAQLAGETMNPDDYLLNRGEYLTNSETVKPILTPISFKAATQSSLKQQAINYWNNSVDFRNGGRPDQLATALRDHPHLRDTLEQDMGSSEFKRLEAGLSKLVNSMGISWGSDKLFADNAALSDKMSKVWDSTNNYGMKQVANEIETEVNKRNYMTSVNDQGQYDSAIAQTEENIKNLKILQRISTGVNDTSYASDIATKAELLAEIRVAMSPYGSGDFKKRLARVKRDVANKTAEQDIHYPWYAYLNPYISGLQIFRAIQQEVTGVPASIRREETEDIKATKTVSQFIEDAQTLKGRVMLAVEQKKLTFKDSLDLIAKVDLAIGVEGYDSLTSQKGNWFTQGYDAFSTYARNLNLRLGVGVEGNRRFRDDTRTQMMDRFSTIMAGYNENGVPLTEGKTAEVIAQIKYEKSQQLHPEIMGAKDGDPIRAANGEILTFRGFDNNGDPIINKKGIDAAVNNL